MAILEILQFPDARLHQKAVEVTEITAEIKNIISDMFDTLYGTPNTAGFAAVQFNILHRIVVIDLSANKDEPMCFINPVLSNFSEEKTFETEGCLSVEFADFHAPVYRSKTVTVEALDAEGKPFKINCEDFLARCIQHEVDHLNGVLFVDYLSPLKRKRLQDKIKKHRRFKEKNGS
jgi:peptide deformylase